MTKQLLPLPKIDSNFSLEKAIKSRRSIRNFVKYNLSLEEISQLLWSAYGITDKNTNFHSVPSAGATFPLEIYYTTSEGVFHYIPQEHSVEQTIFKDITENLSNVCWNQQFIKKASISIIICAVYERTTLYYGERGYRYVYIEVGHVAENLCLQAVSLGLGSVCIGAFDDARLKKLLLLPKDVEPIYIVTIGKPK